MAWLRDLTIIVYCLLSSVVLVLLAVLAYSAYRRMGVLEQSLKRTMINIEAISAAGSEVVKPMVQVITLIEGLRLGISAVTGFMQSKQRRQGHEQR